jgi:SnoaL-like domain
MADQLTLELGVEQPLEAAAAAATTWEPWRGDLLAIPGKFPRDEVEAAFREYLRRANANDWDAWCDLFTEDVHYVDHYFGVMDGLEAVRNWMVPLMAGQPEMKFPPGWHVLAGDVVINYNWNRWPNPDGSYEPYDDVSDTTNRLDAWKYQFPCITLDRYAGDGKFNYEENFYSAPAYLGVWRGWQAEMGLPQA